MIPTTVNYRVEGGKAPPSNFADEFDARKFASDRGAAVYRERVTTDGIVMESLLIVDYADSWLDLDGKYESDDGEPGEPDQNGLAAPGGSAVVSAGIDQDGVTHVVVRGGEDDPPTPGGETVSPFQGMNRP